MGPTSSTTAPATTTTTIIDRRAYKGKVTRSWQQLPPELIRLVATHYLLEVSAHNYCPQAWEARELWPYRMVYVCLRDANELEKLMQICPTWASALSTHLFWQTACAIIDPNDMLARYAYIQPPPNASATAAVLRHSPHRHFRNITHNSCHVCRVNFPYANNGLSNGKKYLWSPTLGNLTVCRDHKRTAFCALCLRQAIIQGGHDNELDMQAMCAENEDEETWPNVETTCRACREEALWRRVVQDPVKREAVGFPGWVSPDWETRQTVEAFIDMGEGNISDVITLAQDKLWLRRHTKIADFLGHALAASKLASREEGVAYESEDEFSDEDDDELIHLTEEAGGMKILAIDDWARHRILDGYWFSPADQWYQTKPRDAPVVRAEHPAAWSISYDLDDDPNASHPLPATVRVETPPSFSLCEQVHGAWQRQLRIILLPAMTNIVRRLVIECTTDGVDPAVKASKMTLDEVVTELRREETWFNGIDWSQRRINDRREQRERERRERAQRTKEEDELSSSSSGKSEGSHTTSPVLSTSTLQTTPSPPPTDEKREAEEDEALLSPTSFPIPISPVLKSPELLHPIPYVPVSATDLPQCAQECLKTVWREACAPLYHCRCRICERAVLNANLTAGTVVPSNTQQIRGPQTPPRQIVIEDAHDVVVDATSGETPADIIQYLAQLQQEEARRKYAEEEEESEGEEELLGKGKALPVVVPTKRSSVHLDAEAHAEEYEGVNGPRTPPPRGTTPPKRVRLQGAFTGATKATPEVSPCRKRSSEEADDAEDDSSEEYERRSSSRSKRAKTSDGRASSISSPGASPPQTSTPITADSEEDLEVVAVQPGSRKRDGAETPRSHDQQRGKSTTYRVSSPKTPPRPSSMVSGLTGASR